MTSLFASLESKALLKRELLLKKKVQILFFVELNPIGKGGKIENGRVTSSESEVIHLKMACKGHWDLGLVYDRTEIKMTCLE